MFASLIFEVYCSVSGGGAYVPPISLRSASAPLRSKRPPHPDVRTTPRTSADGCRLWWLVDSGTCALSRSTRADATALTARSDFAPAGATSRVFHLARSAPRTREVGSGGSTRCRRSRADVPKMNDQEQLDD